MIGSKMGLKKFKLILKTTIPRGSSMLYLTYFNLRDNAKMIRDSKKKLDFIVLDEVIPYLSDVFTFLKSVRKILRDDGKLIIRSVPKITITRSVVGLFKKGNSKKRNWIPKQLLHTLLYLSGFWPRFEVSSCIIADTIAEKSQKKYTYSIIIPAYNEEGNIANCINRVPDFGRDYEIIVVNDGSNDQTAQIVREIMKKDDRVKLIDYSPNHGKGYATKKGLDAATKDVLMILDADMTVKPEDIQLFIEPFESKSAEFVNGTRMVYPMQDQAMRTVNLFGNKMFSIIFSFILNQNVTDTLCGTKCLFRKDYKRILMEDNSWPDFDLLFGASKLNLKIVEVPIHYQNRVAGESKMKTLKHGWMLLKASFRGFFELKLKL